MKYIEELKKKKFASNFHLTSATGSERSKGGLKRDHPPLTDDMLTVWDLRSAILEQQIVIDTLISEITKINMKISKK